MITHDYTVIYKEKLQWGRYPKRERIARNKAFVQGLPDVFPKDLKEWMTKYYIDVETDKNCVTILFGELNKQQHMMSIPIRIKNHMNGATERLLIQTPIMKTPFGMTSKYEMSMNNDLPKFTLSLNFNFEKCTHVTLFKNIKYIEANIKDHCIGKKIFRKGISRKNLDEMFCSQIKQTKNIGIPRNTYPPLLNLKVREKTIFFKENGEKLNLPLHKIIISPGDSVQTILEIRQVWVKPSRVGIIMVPRQIRVFKSTRNLIEEQYAFQDSSDDE